MAGERSAPQDGERLLAQVRALPGGAELMELAQGGAEAALVGGATRDLLRGTQPRELDVVVAGDAAAFARELAQRIDGAHAEVTAHERFGTALVRWPHGRVDVAQRRRESYSAPGALPDVRPADALEDLRRRDFTVNAIAMPLAGPSRGALLAVPDALQDLAAKRLRVLHERSFIDDPTRLMRLARYSARLGFQAEERTAALARNAIEAGAPGTVSGARLGGELRLALSETDALGALAGLDRLGMLAALAPGLSFDEPLARRALAALPGEARADLLLLAVVLLPLVHGEREGRGCAAGVLLERLEFTAAERDVALGAARLAPALASQLEQAARASQVGEALARATLQSVALAAALAPQAGPAARAAHGWLEDWRHVRLQITGEDLLAAGLSPGPQVGRALAAALARKLDGELAGGREQELRAALEAVR